MLQVLDLLETLITFLLYLLKLHILLLDLLDGSVDFLLYDLVLVLHSKHVSLLLGLCLGLELFELGILLSELLPACCKLLGLLFKAGQRLIQLCLKLLELILRGFQLCLAIF